MTSDARGCLKAIAIRSGKRAPMTVQASATINLKAGVSGDYGRRAGKRQVTVLSEEAWRQACDELGAALPWTTRRANLLVAGIPLRPLAGSRLLIGDVILEVTGETDPCIRMDQQHAGLKQALAVQARGGVTCRVLAGGNITPGDEVMWRPAMHDLFAADGQRVAS